MPNEMTPLEAAEKLESLATEADSIEPEKYGGAKLVDVTFHVPGDIKALRYSASLCRKIAAGEVRPVIHAHWKHNSMGWPICSNCGIEAAESDDEGPITGDYCCHCGALMGGKDDSHAAENA